MRDDYGLDWGVGSGYRDFNYLSYNLEVKCLYLMLIYIVGGW